MLIDLLRNRRSIRRYQEKPVEAAKIGLLVEAMLRSPSSRSLNPWEFVVVEDPALLGDLAQAKAHGASFVKGAPLAMVICADPGKCDVWVEDCSIATLLVHLAAADLGLGSCWIQLRERQHDSGKSSESYVKELLGLADHLVVLAMVAIGYPAEEKPGHPADSLLWERVKRLP